MLTGISINKFNSPQFEIEYGYKLSTNDNFQSSSRIECFVTSAFNNKHVDIGYQFILSFVLRRNAKQQLFLSWLWSTGTHTLYIHLFHSAL